jgi:hypothetical protein
MMTGMLISHRRLEMSNRLSLTLAIALFTASLITTAASAAPTPPGVNLRWDQCFSDGGVMNKTFACDTNTGSERLVMSVVLDADKADVSGQELRLMLQSATPTLPSWWAFANVGTCRQTSMTFATALPLGAVNCLDWADGQATGGIGSYSIGFFGPNSVLLQIAAAVPQSSLATLLAGQEYFVGSLVINHAKTVGTGACLGCDQPVCILFDRLRVTTPVFENNLTLINAANGPDSQFARWQGGHETNVAVDCSGHNLGCIHSFTCVPATATGTRGSTWGAVKALYR